MVFRTHYAGQSLISKCIGYKVMAPYITGEHAKGDDATMAISMQANGCSGAHIHT